MGDNSKGSRRRTRRLLRKSARASGLSTLTRTFQALDIGDRAAIVLDPGVHRGMPHPRFNGRTGSVIGVQGSAYVLQVRDGGKLKRVVSRPEHLKRVD